MNRFFFRGGGGPPPPTRDRWRLRLVHEHGAISGVFSAIIPNRRLFFRPGIVGVAFLIGAGFASSARWLVGHRRSKRRSMYFTADRARRRTDAY